MTADVRELEIQVAALRILLGKMLDLHQREPAPDPGPPTPPWLRRVAYCGHDLEDWPCPTVQLATDAEMKTRAQ